MPSATAYIEYGQRNFQIKITLDQSIRVQSNTVVSSVFYNVPFTQSGVNCAHVTQTTVSVNNLFMIREPSGMFYSFPLTDKQNIVISSG